MILTGPEILKQVKAKKIQITPFDKKRVNPASYDLTLGDQVAVYTDAVVCIEWEKTALEDGRYFYQRPGGGLDSKREMAVQSYKMDTKYGWLLMPGILYLMHTAEEVSTDHFVPILDGKSSIGRLGIVIHLTAGFGDPGYSGQYTLEVTAVHPVRVYPGMRFCQMRFHRVEGEILSYEKTGNYKGKAASGPVPSKAWKSAFK